LDIFWILIIQNQGSLSEPRWLRIKSSKVDHDTKPSKVGSRQKSSRVGPNWKIKLEQHETKNKAKLVRVEG